MELSSSLQTNISEIGHLYIFLRQHLVGVVLIPMSAFVSVCCKPSTAADAGMVSSDQVLIAARRMLRW